MRILIKSVELETGITYAHTISEEDAFKILESQGREDELIDFESGQFKFTRDKIMIKTIGVGAYLQKDDVIDQINDQL